MYGCEIVCVCVCVCVCVRERERERESKTITFKKTIMYVRLSFAVRVYLFEGEEEVRLHVYQRLLRRCDFAILEHKEETTT